MSESNRPKPQRPTRTKEHSPIGGEKLRHPAFGALVLTQPTISGEGDHFFGSDLPHNTCIRIALYEAEQNRRHKGDSHMAGALLAMVEMSHAQFAEFITSPGKGSGTPCTVRWLQGKGEIPSIVPDEPKGQTIRRELRETASQPVSEALGKIDDVLQRLDAGQSVGKRELRDMLTRLRHSVDNIPSNLAFAVDQAERAIESTVSEARIEIEAMQAIRGATALPFESIHQSLEARRPSAGGAGTQDGEDDAPEAFGPSA